MAVEVVVKFGGSLERQAAFLKICEWTWYSLRDKKAVIMPGGGIFADIVRVCDKRWELNAATSHWMAVLAMDQFGYLLAEKIPGAVTTRTEADIARAHAAGFLPVFLPSVWLRHQRNVPESWDVTSDSISCVFAIKMKASKLVLLKDRLPEDACTAECLQEAPASEFSQKGWVDPMFAHFLSSWGGEAWLCDGTQRLSVEAEVKCGGNRCLRLR